MPKTEVNRPRSNHGPRNRAVLVSPHVRVEFPLAPREATHTGDAPSLALIERPGRQPLVRVTAGGIRIHTFTAVLAHRDGAPVEGVIGDLRAMAHRGAPLVYQYGSQLEAGIWRISNLTIAVQRRHPDTDAAAIAEAQVELTEATGISRAVGPASGGHDDGHPKGDDKARTYTWRSSDKPADVSRRLYGRPDLFDAIARANGIRHPARIKAGRKLRVPPRQRVLNVNRRLNGTHDGDRNP